MYIKYIKIRRNIIIDDYIVYILLGIGLVAVLGIIVFLFNKVTPSNTPANLSKFYLRILGTAIVAAVVTFILLGLFI